MLFTLGDLGVKLINDIFSVCFRNSILQTTLSGKFSNFFFLFKFLE